MINETFLYHRDKGLFKQVLNLSAIMQGRYHVSPNYGHDLNTGNLDQYLKDPAYALTDVKQKYPIAVLLTPRSRIIKDANGNTMEEFTFHMYFLTQTFIQNHQVKMMDKDTNASSNHVWQDWGRMKMAAQAFHEMLKLASKKSRLNNNPFTVDDRADIVRVSKLQNDKVSGVGLTFLISLYSGVCDVSDYGTGAIDSIIIPNPNDF